VLQSHPRHEVGQRIALLATVKLLGNELFVPAYQGIRRGQSSKGFEAFAAGWKSEGSQTTAFGIGAADALITKLSVKGATSFQEIGDDRLLVTIDPAGDHGDENLQYHGDSRDCKRRDIHSIEYTANPQEFNEVTSADCK
jgi:hypothetical protein